MGIGVLWLVVQLPYPLCFHLGCGLGKLALRFMKQHAKIMIATWNCASGNERTRTP
ncbi:hypothetical protein ACLBR5_21520 [Escherichia coli]